MASPPDRAAPRSPHASATTARSTISSAFLVAPVRRVGKIAPITSRMAARTVIDHRAWRFHGPPLYCKPPRHAVTAEQAGDWPVRNSKGDGTMSIFGRIKDAIFGSDAEAQETPRPKPPNSWADRRWSRKARPMVDIESNLDNMPGADRLRRVDRRPDETDRGGFPITRAASAGRRAGPRITPAAPTTSGCTAA